MAKKRAKADGDRCPWYEFTAQADEHTAELKIFGPIGGGFFVDEDAVTAKRVVEQLDALPDSILTIRVLVNSPGGSVFDGIHIANALRRQRDEHGRNVVVEIDALAASAATIITSAGDSIRMPQNALMMVHNPFALAIGDAGTMRSLAKVLDKVRNTIVSTYQWVSKLAPEEIRGLMDETTWMDADEALGNGFITEISDPVEAAAFLDVEALAHLERIPDEYKARVMAMLAADEKAGDDTSDPTHGDTTTPAPETGADTDDNDQGATASAEPSEGKMNPKPKQTPTDAPDATVILAAERERVSAIEKRAEAGKLGGLDATAVDDAAKLAKADSVSAEKFGEQILDMLVDSPPNKVGPTPVPAGITAGEDEHDKRSIGIEAALLSRVPGMFAKMRAVAAKFPDNPVFQDMDFDGAEFRNVRLVDHMKADLERMAPGSCNGLSARRILVDFSNAANLQTTSDFSVGLENTMHKILLASFLITPDTWREICAVGEVSDFRAHNRFRTGFIASLSEVLEDGEFTNRTLPDAAKETITALTYGNIVGLSRKAIINDDMSMFARVGQQVGRAAGLTVEELFYALLALNAGLGPLMNDGTAMFDATHNNLGAGAAISAAAVDADATIMEAQQDGNTEEYLNVRPSRLLVPRGLKGTAVTLNESQFDPDTADSNKPNITLGLFDRVVATPRLTGTRRYMFADPEDTPCIEVAFLNGEQEPFMEMRDGWNTDGVEWKVRLDVGVSGVEFRSGLTDAGV